MSKSYRFGLCLGRHELPSVDGYIYGNTVDPMDFAALSACASAAIPSDADSIELYVTGLTPATLAVVKHCHDNSINLTCWHYDRESGDYRPQVVISGMERCSCGCRHLWGTSCPACGL